MKYILLEKYSGGSMTMRDHTEWFRRRGGMIAVENYHRSVINGAQTRRCAGSMENIKRLVRMDNMDTVQILVLDGHDITKEISEAWEQKQT